MPVKKLNKIPEHTYWVKAGCNADSMIAAVLNIEQYLVDNGADFVKFNEGEYSQFKIDSLNQISFYSMHGYHFMKPFIFKYLGGFEQIEKALTAYNELNSFRLTVWIRDWKGNEVRVKYERL